MRLPLLYEAFEQNFENVRLMPDEINLCCKCPYCGGSEEDRASFSIKINPEEGEPILFICYRASCGRKGALKSDMLEEIGIMDPNVYAEVAAHNRTVSPNFDQPFHSRIARDYTLVNLPRGNNIRKLTYINQRLGVKLSIGDLKDLKIQLSLLDLLRINDIKKLAASEGRVKELDMHCVGFISIFRDYMICRDITPDLVTGKRYYNYQIAGKKEEGDLKIYSIPRDIDLMDPHSAIINVAEGPFSILGAYLNTDLGRERPNNVWLANCGSEYTNTILRVCKQFGLLKVRINIWSDSEIKLSKYQKLYRDLKNRMDIRRMIVYYNRAAEDFGHAARDIELQTATVYTNR